MKKISIGSWAYVFGAFREKPIPLEQMCEKLAALGFDGVSLAGFKPHAHPELFATQEKRQALAALLRQNGLEMPEYLPDLWSKDALADAKGWRALYARNIEFMDAMDFRRVRIDSGTQPILPAGMSYGEAKLRVTENFSYCARLAARYGIEVVWEFEPGFIVNEPRNVLEVAAAVGEPNFSVLFDTCHGYMSAVIGARHIEEGCTLEGGLVEFIHMLRGRIGLVHIIDADGTLNGEGTSTHSPFGEGKIDFSAAMPALGEAYNGEWWTIDLCECPDAWEKTAACKAFADQINPKFG